MAKIKPERAYAKEILDGFSGIGAGVTVDQKHATDIRNFRILSDGSLQKRGGWVNRRVFSQPVRAFWEGTLGQESYSFAVAGNRIYRIDGSALKQVGTLPDSVGRLQFFSFGERLFLPNGSLILSYRASTDSFVEAEGYAPLIGRNWHPTDLGEINEPVNLLSKHVRVHYFNTTGSDTFCLPFYAEKIDQVRVNSSITTSFSMDSSTRYVIIPSAASASYVEIAFTMETADDLRARITSCKNAFVARSADRTILALYGSSYQNLLFCASPVSELMHNASQAVYPNSDELYFPQSGLLTLGDRDHPLTSLYYHMGRVLAFHSDGAFSVVFAKDGSRVEYYPILRGMGCRAIDAAVYLDGDPVVINAGGIFRLHATVSEPDTFEIKCISEELPQLCGEAFADNAIVFEDPVHRELWFSSPSIEGGRVWVYQIEQRLWVSFDNVSPTFFCFIGSLIGFASGKYLRVFDEELCTDDGEAIVATYTSPYFPFSYPERIKRALRMTVCSHSTHHRLQVTVRTERCEKVLSLTHEFSSVPIVLDARVPLGRFHMAQVELCDENSARTRIYRLALLANL